MVTGQQDYWNTSFNINYRNAKKLQFNKLLRIKNMVEGWQRDNRLATKIQSADNDPDMGETADQKSTVVNWVMNQQQMYETISDCFGGGFACGLNLMQMWVDYREDTENGEIKAERIPFSGFLMDPYWTKQDLSDCGRIWTRRFLSPNELLSLMPDLKKEMPSLGKGYVARDGKFQFLPQNWYQYNESLYAYDEYWTRDYRKQRQVLDKVTGEMVPWKGTKEQFQVFRRINPNIELITTSVPTVKWHILVNNQLVYEETRPWGLDRFPHVPFVCYHFPEVQNYAYRYQGFVRNCRDSQLELNKRRNTMLDIMDAQIQSGLMVKEDALVNPEDAFEQGPGKILFFKQSSNLASDVMPIPAPPVAGGWMEFIQSMDKEIMEIVGTPEEMYGQNIGTKEMSGVLMKLMQGAGLTSLRNVFDRLNYSQKMVGEIILDLVQENFSREKVAKVLGKPPVEDFFNTFENKYTCVVEEGELTATQRQLQFLQAVQLKQIIPEAIDDDYLIDKSTLSGKKEIIEKIMQRKEQAAEMQRMQMAQQIQQMRLMNKSVEAKSEADFASAIERRSRAVADIGLAKERSSEAMHDRAAAALDNAKALKELDEMDENRLMKLANFIVEMQIKQKAAAGDEEGDSEYKAEDVGAEVEAKRFETDNPEMQEEQQEQPVGVDSGM